MATFEECWESIRKEAFRLELLDTYDADEERDQFQKFLHGNLSSSELEAENASWFAGLRDRAARGIQLRRVHVVSIPLSPYLKFEVEFYKISEKCGERVYLLTRQEFDKIPESRNVKDFWLFDDKVALFLEYDDHGKWIAEKSVDDPGRLPGIIALKNSLLASAIPMKEFLDRVTSGMS